MSPDRQEPSISCVVGRNYPGREEGDGAADRMPAQAVARLPCRPFHFATRSLVHGSNVRAVVTRPDEAQVDQTYVPVPGACVLAMMRSSLGAVFELGAGVRGA